MFEWLSANYVTVIACAVISVSVILAVASIIRDKKKGKSSCGCSCAGCPMSGQCHADKK